MRLKLSAGLRYPITVTKLLKPLSDPVKHNEAIFNFSYTTVIEQDILEGDDKGEVARVETLYHSRFESESEGTLKKWLVRERQIIHEPIDVAEIEETCAHEAQFAGLCLECGKAMEWVDYNVAKKPSERANVNMLHDNVLLKVAPSAALKAENESKRRLVNAKKLSLVVDLDQTVIHATLDPTVAEWQSDPTNPNYEAVQDVVSFDLKDDVGRDQRYYMKLRPGLQHFLEEMSKLFELHIYTMGTRAYAVAVAKFIDPDKNFFGERILSRDESGSMHVKSLRRLFPNDQKMVVIIDDRSDVWQWSKSLYRVVKYVYWPEVGDINASYLPPVAKTVNLPASNSSTSEKDHDKNGTNGSAGGDATGDDSTLEQLIEMSGGDSEEELKKKTEKVAQAIDAQVRERPLAQQQAALDKKDEAISRSGSNSGGSPDGHTRHSVLKNINDCELKYVEEGLRRVHTSFFEEYEQNKASALRGSSKTADPSETLDAILPDVREVMPYIKESVFEDVSAVFSGVFEMGADVFRQDMVVWASEFGLTVRENLRKSTTHLIAARTGSAKVKLALRQGKGKIKIVNTRWLMDSIQQWKKLDETKYMLHSEDDYIEPVDDRTGIEDQEEALLSDSGEPVDNITDGDTTDTERARPMLRKIKTKSKKQFLEAELEPDTDEEYEPQSPFDNKKPIGGDETTWEGMDDELAEFIDDDDSDAESVATGVSSKKADGSRTPLALSQGNKRRLEEIGDDAGEDGPRKRSRDTEGNKEEADDDNADEDWDPLAVWDEEEEEEERQRQSAENSPEVKEGAAFPETKGDEQQAKEDTVPQPPATS